LLYGDSLGVGGQEGLAVAAWNGHRFHAEDIWLATRRHRGPVLAVAFIVVLLCTLLPAGVVLADDPSGGATPSESSTPVVTTDPAATTVTTATDTSGAIATTDTAPTTTVADSTPVVSAADTGLTRYEQTDSRLSYSGTWSTYAKADASGQSYGRSSTSGASLTIVFDGQQLDWIAMKGTTTGIADVYLDGVKVQTLDLANSVAVYQQRVYSTGVLDSGVHTVRIVRSASSASGKYLTVDAVEVSGTLLATAKVQQSDSRLAYKGSWTDRSSSSYSGGSDKAANSLGASVTIEFTGTYLAWVGKKGANYGIAKITVDGTDTYAADAYDPAAAYQATIWASGKLANGAHTITIEWTGTKNAASTDTYVSLDAFTVIGSLTQAYVWNRYEQDDPRLLFFGTWSTTAATQASGGSDKRANTSSASLTLTFTGKQLDWIATVGPDMGKADVSVDGGPAQTVDLYSPTLEYQQKVWSSGTLSAGTHRVEIAWQEGNASGVYITVDAFNVLGSLPSSLTLTKVELKWVEQRLTDLSYRPGTVDGVVDSKTTMAVIAFQKWEGLTRDGKITATLFNRLLTASRPKPTRNGTSNPWIEVNKSKQVLLYCKDGQVVWTLAVSTGSASVGIVTPSGTFKVLRKTLETDPRYLPLYITTGHLAIHGYPNVPTYPASHGCIRTPLWNQDELHSLIPVGTYVYIY
jgi:peptidoglycan hydrolase-like protein with peptidoglycan-binding domain